MIRSFVFAVAALSTAVPSPSIPPFSRDAATAAITKKELVARHDSLACPIFVSRIATMQGGWAFVDAGCSQQPLIHAIFHYSNGAWNFACSHGIAEPWNAQKAMRKCGMTHAQALEFGFPDGA